jgi:photosystem II stability/assembly factor-like uncharacterized protein
MVSFKPRLILARLAAGAVCLLAGAASAGAAPPSSEPAAQPAAELRAYQAVSAQAGWVWIGESLFWTDDAGRRWREITPPVPGLAAGAVAAAAFADASSGWVVATHTDHAGVPLFSLARTTDGGRSWQTTHPDFFEPGEQAALAGALHLEFVDAGTGWLVVRQATSSLFSRGTLFGTRDGGQTWTRLAMPNGSPVHFRDARNGWVEAGPLDPNAYVTTDGGRSWRVQRVDAAPLAEAARAAGLTEASLASTSAGWARSTRGECQDGACRLSTELLRTEDGGRTWTPLALPGGQQALERAVSVPTEAATAQEKGGRMVAYDGQGFDTCIIGRLPTLGEMQAWATHSPYRVRNLYLGGASMANCGTLTLAYVQSLAQQGWLFIPTWVGPQAPCSNFNRKMPNDPGAAYDQGVIEAHLALNTAKNLGLTLPDGSGTVLYYDVEAYVGDSACRAVVKALIDGWTATLHATGNRSGVYGSTCRSYISDFATLPHVPDMVWLAVWMTNPAYNPNASVWNLSCLDNSLWADGQRIRQYAGDHSETWGEVSLRIDSNVMTATLSTAAGSCAPAAGQVAFFVYPEFGGQCVLKNTGDYPTPASMGLPPDSISSLRIGEGVALRLCRAEFYGGLCQDFTSDAAELGQHEIGDNLAASAKVEATPLAATGKLILPLVIVGLPEQLALPNGGFELGATGWQIGSAQQQPVVVSAVDLPAGVVPYAGSGAAWLGGAHDEAAFIQQQVVVPHNAPTLTYWQRISSAESRCHYDYVSLWVNGKVVASYGLCTGTASLSWTRHSLDLQAYAGQSVTLRIQVTTDGTLSSSLFLDNVGFQAPP